MAYHCINGEYGCGRWCYDVRNFDEDYWLIILQCSAVCESDGEYKQISCNYIAKTQDDIDRYSPRIVDAAFGSIVRAPQWCPMTKSTANLIE